MNFVHLHNHSQYSLMDGLCSPQELVAAAKDLRQTAMSITDHGTLSGHREMQIAAMEAGIKPILGVEAYISETDRFDRRQVKDRDDNTSVFNHIILLAKDDVGVENLNKLSEIAWTEGFYRKPRIDMDALAEHPDGLIVLSGCMNGLIAKNIERGNIDRAEEITEQFKNRFGDDFYMEVQPHNPPELNTELIRIADYYSVQIVATADCHYATADQKLTEEALLILSTKPKIAEDATFAASRKIDDPFERFNYLYPDRPISFEDIDVYVQSADQMRSTLPALSVANTEVIAAKVGEYSFKQGLSLLPQPKDNAHNRLVTLCNQGMKKKGFVGNSIYEKRLALELDIINKKNFDSYFLIEANMIAWAKKQGIMVGPGRGSAAGSLVCYLLGITQADPIRYKLLFARFINEERNDYPDIDCDFQDTRRHEVKEYLRRQFKNVASISTYNYFKDKGVVRDAARVYHVPLGDVNKALKTIDSFEDYISSPNTAEFRKKYPEVTTLAKQLRGRIRGVGAHAAGVVVAKDSLSKYTPLETRTDKNDLVTGRVVVTAADMDQAADIGLIKFDILGLKTLTTLANTLESLKERRNLDIVLEDIPLDDPDVYAMLNAGFTKGVFQAEAVPYTNLIMKLGVSQFEDLVASTSLVRPGAMNTVGHDYMARKQGRQSVTYMHDILKEITEDTYGVIIYQEQVMQACVGLGGMSWSEADKIRKIIGKKKDVREFEQYRKAFVDGASEHITPEAAEHLWKNFEAHAGYSFNRSHAVVYSMITYWTAWFKKHYPLEFMYALLKSEGDGDTRTDYLIEAKRLGIKILLPHINTSQPEFALTEDAIQFGLGDIKSISPEKGAMRIIAGRPYDSYAAFREYAAQKGSGVNTRMIASLDAVGAARFADNPLRGDEADNFYEYLNIPKFSTGGLSPEIMKMVSPVSEFEEKGCFVFLAMVKSIKRAETWSRIELVDESGSIGLFHSPQSVIESGQMYLLLAADNRIARFIPIDDVESREDDAFVRFLKVPELNIDDKHKVVLSFNGQKAKSGKMFGHVVLAEKDKTMNKALVFTKKYPLALSKFTPGAVVHVELGRTDNDALYVEEILND